MALIWQRERAGNRYQVRTHGASVRLYSNGVFHSQWNPRDPLKGSLWELLLLPVFFLTRERAQRILVLGVGGGAVIRLLQEFLQPQRIVGVDIDPTHLEISRRFFGVCGAELVCADARAFVREQQVTGSGACFDVIIDDLFGHVDGEAIRAVPADQSWCEGLLELLADDGIVIGNFASRRELLGSGWRSSALREMLAGAWTADLPEYENSVGVFSRKPLAKSALTSQAPAPLNPANPHRKLTARWRPLR